MHPHFETIEQLIRWRHSDKTDEQLWNDYQNQMTYEKNRLSYLDTNGHRWFGFKNKASAYATALVYHASREYVREIVEGGGKPAYDTDIADLGETLKDAVTYTVIYPEGDDGVSDLSDLHSDFVDSMVDDINWYEIAKVWTEEVYGVPD